MKIKINEITHHDITPDITGLFDISKPTMPRALNILEGIMRGQIIVDDQSNPAWACVRDGIYGTLYFGGQINTSLVAFLVERFRQIGEVGIGCWLDDDLNNMLPSTFNYDGRTLYFAENKTNNDLLGLSPSIDYTLAERNQALFNQSFDYQSTLDAFGSIKNVLSQTLGIAVLYEGKVVCEAATGAPTHGLIEVGVTTHEAHRQRGLATIACAHLIQLCESKGYKTWWDCARQNTPSVKLARKLGYRNEKEYRYVWWKKK
jgi:RimJ/RimL family protein N-acetyltransferase